MSFQKRKKYREMVYEMGPLALARKMSHLFYSKNVQMTKIPKMLEMTLAERDSLKHFQSLRDDVDTFFFRGRKLLSKEVVNN